MRKLLWPVLVAFGLLSMGCETTLPSMNVQRSLLRGTGDAGSTVVLDNQNEADVDDIAAGIRIACSEVIDFLETGDVSDLTKGELKDKLEELLPSGVDSFVTDILSMVNVKVDTDKIGTRNVKRVKAFLIGVIRGSSRYAVEDR